MTVTKLRIKNFLSLENVEVELGKLNLFVGPNASGKSNLAKAFQLLAYHVKNGVPCPPSYRSFKDLAYNFNEVANIVLEVEGKVNNHNIQYTLTLTADNYFEKAWMNGNEILSSNGKSLPANILTQGRVMTSVSKPGDSCQYFRKRSVYKAALTNLPSNAIKELHILANTLRNITVHSFSPERIRARSSIMSSPILGYHGENLARVLLHLYLENRKTFTNIEDVVCSLVPEVEEIIPHLEETNVEIWLKVKGLLEPLKPYNISDGTLRILAYVTVLYSGTSLVVFEEPENCIHPHLLETIIDLARKAPCQVVITTHSPYLLDYVKPDEVYVVEKPKVATIVKKLSKTKEVQAVKKLLEQWGTLSEAWYSGLIGGVPETT